MSHALKSRKGEEKNLKTAPRRRVTSHTYVCLCILVHTLRMAYDARACVFIFTYTNTHTHERARAHTHIQTEPQAEDSAQMARDVAAAMLRKIDSRSSVAEAAEIGRQIVNSQCLVQLSTTN